MHFSRAAFALLLTTLVAARPAPVPQAGNSAAVLTDIAGMTWQQIQISDGTAGDAPDRVNALLSAIDQTDLANVARADVETLNAINAVCNDAETEGFNPAIAAAKGAEKAALEIGKSRNKVLKGMAKLLAIQIEIAQGGDDSELATEEKKVANNTAADADAAGEASTSVDFDGPVEA